MEVKLTDKVVSLYEDFNRALGISRTYVLFGDYPQSVKTDDVIIDDTRTFYINNWKCYQGSDHYFYIKEKVKSYENIDKYKFSNGQSVVYNQEYYFKIEPIKWRILDNNYNGAKLMFAENALDVCAFDNHVNEFSYVIEREANGKEIQPNNYEYSNIRAFLNGLDGSSYDVENYSSKGFINMAFSDTAKNLIKTVNISNGVEDTKPSGCSCTPSEDYLCNDTKDKIFLLSEKEVTNQEYGFALFPNEDEGKIRIATDYAIAKGGCSPFATKGQSNWWLRSIAFEENFGNSKIESAIVLDNGDIQLGMHVDYECAIVPALCI